MSVSVDRAHHHPRVYKNRAYWCVRCPRCGVIRVANGTVLARNWRTALVAALLHHSEHLS